MNNNFYTYVYLDPRKIGNFIYNDLKFGYEPFYVGKGKGNRCFSGINDKHKGLKKAKIASIINEGLYPIVIKLYNNITEEESFVREIELIKLIGRLDQNNGPLTNMTDGGDGTSGRIDTIKDIERKRNFRHSPEWKSILSKPIIQYKEGVIVNEFSSIKEAAEKLNLIPQNISSVLTGKYKTTGGFHFEFKNQEDVIQKHTREKPQMPKHSESTKIKMSQSARKGEDHPQYKKRGKNSQFSKRVHQLTEDGRLIKVWDSVMDIKRGLGFSPSNISRCCHGAVKRIGGFKWKYQ